MNRLKEEIKNKKPFVIGMVHCAPLSGYEDSPGESIVKEKFINDLEALISGGIDAIMIENNYDIPHYEKAKESTIPQLTDLCLEARKLTKKPLGICVLWNDYERALLIAKKADLDFVRIPVFVDKVKTDYGIYSAKADECIKFRKKINAQNILIFADVQVKHAEHLIKRPLTEAVTEAIKKQADGIIITGKWTGDPPTLSDVQEAKMTSGETILILGSGVTPENSRGYNVNGFIVGTYFKEESERGKDFHNVFPWKSKIMADRVKKFMGKIR